MSSPAFVTMTASSDLWTRRLSTANVFVPLPKLAPLSLPDSFSDKKESFEDIKSDCSNVTTAPSSPMLYTPTEMASILLGDSPQSAFRRCRNRNEEILRSQNQFDSFYNSDSLSPIPSHAEECCALYAFQHNELDVEIEMASLATEVALRTLESDDEEMSLEADQVKIKQFDQHTWSKSYQQPRMHLLPSAPSPNEQKSAKEMELPLPEIIKGKFDGHEAILCKSNEKEDDLPKPPRKGRARMSQEKRRRLARRREREALLLGLSSSDRPHSAPAFQTKFSLEEVNEPLKVGKKEAWSANLQMLGNHPNMKTFPLPPHPYRNELRQRRDSLVKKGPAKSYSQCLTVPMSMN